MGGLKNTIRDKNWLDLCNLWLPAIFNSGKYYKILGKSKKSKTIKKKIITFMNYFENLSSKKRIELVIDAERGFP